MAYHTLRAAGHIGDRLVYVDALVEQRINGKIYYTHFVENEEASLRVASSPGTKTGTGQSGEAPGATKPEGSAGDDPNIVPINPSGKPQFSPRQHDIPADAISITPFKSDEGTTAHRDYGVAKAGDQATARAETLQGVPDGLDQQRLADRTGAWPREVEPRTVSTDAPTIEAGSPKKERGLQFSPRVVIDGNMLAPKGTSIQGLRQLGAAAYNQLRSTEVLNEPTGKTIKFDGTGRQKIMVGAGEDLLRLVPALPELLRVAQPIGRPELDARGKPDTAAWHKLQASVEMDGRTFGVILTVREMRDGTFHCALHKDDGREPGALPGSEDKGKPRSSPLDGAARSAGNIASERPPGKGEGPDGLTIVPRDPPSKPMFSPRIDQQDLEKARKTIDKVADARRRGEVDTASKPFGGVTPWLVDVAKQHGIEVADYRHAIDVSAVGHISNRHTNRDWAVTGADTCKTGEGSASHPGHPRRA